MPKQPNDADARRAVKPVIVYRSDALQTPDIATYRKARSDAEKVGESIVAPRTGGTFRVKAGQFFRISCIEGTQVGDLNLWSAKDIGEHFYSGKTRALHGTHLTTGDRLWSCLPYLRPMATIIEDTLDWYGFDRFGGGVHDVIGTRCDPYTQRLLTGDEYHHCCHSNLARALAEEARLPIKEAEQYVHDVLNVFMCTGFTRDTGQYFMKASPARRGDYIEFFAEIDLLCALSACPGGDCSSTHSSDEATCHPLFVEVFASTGESLRDWCPPLPNRYSRRHGVQANAASRATSTMSPKDLSRSS